MSLTEKNKEIVHRYVDALNKGDLLALRSLLADDAEIQGVTDAD